jgi:hypothetical protein
MKSGNIKGKRNRPAIVHKVPVRAVTEIAVSEDTVEMLAPQAYYSGSGSHGTGHKIKYTVFKIAVIHCISRQTRSVAVKDYWSPYLNTGRVSKIDPDIFHCQIPVDIDQEVVG